MILTALLSGRAGFVAVLNGVFTASKSSLAQDWLRIGSIEKNQSDGATTHMDMQRWSLPSERPRQFPEYDIFSLRQYDE